MLIYIPSSYRFDIALTSYPILVETMNVKFVFTMILLYFNSSFGFSWLSSHAIQLSPFKFSVPTDLSNFLISSSIPIADTSISEEEVLDIAGQSANLPDPLIAVGFAAVVLIGVAVLQFSLGDLTKEVCISFISPINDFS
jgi:hypothetical protein